jgi:hypothetical protein
VLALAKAATVVPQDPAPITATLICDELGMAEMVGAGQPQPRAAVTQRPPET